MLVDADNLVLSDPYAQMAAAGTSSCVYVI